MLPRFASSPSLPALGVTPQSDAQTRWLVSSPQTAAPFSAVAYFYARALQARLGVPIGILQAAYGGTRIECFFSPGNLHSRPDLRPLAQRVADVRQNPALIKSVQEWRTTPSSVYSTMIHPLVPYGIRGVIWYQGESNAGEARRYRTLFPELITGWRRLWKQGDFPFLFVQLAGFGEAPGGEGPGDSAWAELREAQAMTLRLPHTGLATAVDIGDAKNIHPTNKQDVGKRLALVAGRLVYGWKDEYSGPTFKSMLVKDGKAWVRFDHTTGGLGAKTTPLAGFAVASKNQKFYWADAAIRGNSVVMSSPKVPHPVAVRYAWGDTPPCGLCNGAGLPALPFRTDDWPH